jgi:hypothetical protein
VDAEFVDFQDEDASTRRALQGFTNPGALTKLSC